MNEHYDALQIRIYDEDAIDGLAKAGRLAAETLDFITPYVTTGVTTGALDRLMHQFILDNNAIPAPLHYKGYPKATCVSINHVICHGIPSDARTLKATDMLNIDVTVIVDGWYGDTSRMFYADIKKTPVKAKRITNIAYVCLQRAVAAVAPGNTFGDIGHAIQSYAESQNCSVVQDFVGHGIGRAFHEPPSVFHFGEPGTGAVLQQGMVFTIEPMINLGAADAKILDDGWTAVTKDRSLSAQCEHTLMVIADGCRVFTHSPKGYDCPPYDVL